MVNIHLHIYPRIRVLDDFSRFWREISKKARNRYRYFTRHGGYVETGDPVRYVKNILEINLSDPYRQGRRLPEWYLNPRLATQIAAVWSKHIKMGISTFYIARLGGKVVGYAYIPHLNKYAQVVRFMPHANYMKYGVGNGLLIDIIRDLTENSKANIFQYGYWRNVNPGVNHFLKQHGFKFFKEAIITIPIRKTYSAIAEMYLKYVSLTNITKYRPNILDAYFKV